ncbi:tRNA-dihydrouridine(20) synthase [NAD(P)+]-like [Sarcoptes scabiei]|uniref:tRNA-dihydrouridine(20) synthase [NAD(P)+]-like n=1 Tax=Sarcoptes scabiei TaxID=52283 RepID=A0A834R1L9_SARSC|nr:tRNA-dihydrouridine(20) synthase [NAD(P)+]-like [Sarcoptes scabiei]
MEDRKNHPLYSKKLILGPMVRIGTLPMRLLALNNGAELVYTEEIIDFKLIKSKRFVNDILKTIDFVDDSGVVVFRTCSIEKSKLILQIGTNDPKRAVLAAKMIENDVAGLDINMGCPKSFSLKGGMGAALMTKPGLIQEIISSLKQNVKVPISCKIRVFDDLQETLELLKKIESAGADAVAIHARTKEERPNHPNRNSYIKIASETLKIPVIANGDSSNIDCYDDLKLFQTKTNASSVMISRSAMKNCSIFDRSKRLKSVEEIIKEYLKLALEFDNNAINTKYCIQQMLGSLQESEKGKILLGAYDLKTISAIYELEDFYESIIEERLHNHQKKKIKLKNGSSQNTIYENSKHYELPVSFDKTLFDSDCELPKSILHRWITKNNLEMPKFHTLAIEKQFHCMIDFMGYTYSTPYLEKSKKLAEQSAALVLILKQGLCDDHRIIDSCLIGPSNSIPVLEHNHHGKIYLIKINK